MLGLMVTMMTDDNNDDYNEVNDEDEYFAHKLRTATCKSTTVPWLSSHEVCYFLTFIIC